MNEIKRDCEPNFFIIGASKCGTTSLHHLLRRHPNIYMPEHKELRFFADDELYKSLGYQGYIRRYFAQVDGEKAIGEATPGYLYAPERVIPRLEASLRDLASVRFVVMIRDPVERTISHYFHGRRGLHESRKIRAALFRDEDLGEVDWDCHYVVQSMYTRYIEKWLTRFPRSSFLFLRTEDINDRMKLRELIAFLDVVGDIDIAGARRMNVRGVPRSKLLARLIDTDSFAKRLAKQLFPPALRREWRERIVFFNLSEQTEAGEPLDDVRAALGESFHDEVARLEAMTGLDLAAWRR